MAAELFKRRVQPKGSLERRQGGVWLLFLLLVAGIAAAVDPGRFDGVKSPSTKCTAMSIDLLRVDVAFSTFDDLGWQGL